MLYTTKNTYYIRTLSWPPYILFTAPSLLAAAELVPDAAAAWLSSCICQHTSAYVSIREHKAGSFPTLLPLGEGAAYVRICQHTPALHT